MQIARFVRFPPLRLLRSTRSQGIVALGNKVEVLLPRIAALEKHFDSRPSDVAEQRRRDELIRYVTMLTSHGTTLTLSSRLGRLEEQLRSWFEEQKSHGPANRIQGDDGAFGPLEDIQEAILNYQVRS